MVERLTPRQLAARWDKSTGTLENWRGQGKGPAYLKIGRSVFYELADVVAYEAENKITPKEEAHGDR